MFLFLVLVLCVVFVIRDAQRIRRSRIYKAFRQYPPCLKELPIIGCLYHFIVHNPEDAINKAMEVGRNTMKQGGMTRVCGYKAFYLAMTDAPDIAEILTKCLNKDSYMYSFVQFYSGNGSIFVPDSSISKVRRRVIMPAFSSKKMSSYIDSIWAESVALTEDLKPFVGKGPLTAGAHLGAFCFNNVIRLADIQEIREHLCTLQLLKDFHRMFRLAFERSGKLWMHNNFLYTFSANHKEAKTLLSNVENDCHRVGCLLQ